MDIGFDKLGSLAGGALALLAVALVPSQTARVLFGLSAVLCLAALAFTGRLHRGYVRALEESLRAGRVRLDASDVPDEATLLTLAHSGLGLDRDTLLRAIEALRGSSDATGARDAAEGADPLVQSIVDLRSGEKDRAARPRRRAGTPPALMPH